MKVEKLSLLAFSAIFKVVFYRFGISYGYRLGLLYAMLRGLHNLNNRPEWGVCEIMPLIFEKMKQQDLEILDAAKYVLDILHQKRDMKQY